MTLDTKAMETAARAVYENYYGKNTWKNAAPADRGHARQAVRLTLNALERANLAIVSKPKAGAAPPARPLMRAVR
jgi:hypothetical protein